jgi:diacylglycerol kinase family enzyme
MSDALPVTVILNVSSGHGDPASTEAQIRAGLEAAGRPHRVVVTESPADVERQATLAVKAARENPCVVVAAGGDGTISLVAEHVLETGLQFGVIPLGTFNYFARDLGIPLDPQQAALALATGYVRQVHVARVNGHLFLNNASFGLYRQLLEEREEFKQRFGRYKAVAVASALVTLWHARGAYSLRLDLDGRPTTLRTPMLFFGLNSLQLENLDLDVAHCAREGMLAVIALQPASRWQLLGLAVRGALQGLRNSPDLRCFGATQVEVSQPGRRRTRVAVDGESVDCRLPLHVEIFRNALPVLVPRNPEVRH